MTRAHEQVSLRTADEIEQQASEWLVRVDRDGGTEVSRALAAWLGAHPRHRAAFLRISTAWRRADALRRFADPRETADPDLLAPERPPAEESITEPARLETTFARPSRPSASAPPRSFRFAIAAALALVLAAGLTWFGVALSTTQTYATTLGEFYRVTLADGTSVSLNTNTRVRVALTKTQRRVELLQGEAQFEVAHDSQRPFLVAAGDTVVRAVGTAFVVRLRSQQSVDVLVSEGKVAINPPSRTTVSAGQMALVRKRVITTHAIDDITRRLAWTEGMLIFNGETLADAVGEFNRYNRRQLVIADPGIAGSKIGGAFKATNPDRFATAVQKMFAIEARVYEDTSGAEIRLSRGARDAPPDH
jgi:transmembrane sensor